MGLPFTRLKLSNGFFKHFLVGGRIKGIACDNLETEFAEQDLDGIVEYIAVKLANPPAAVTFFDNVEACYGSLRRTPRMLSECEDKYLKRKGYRKALINNYLLIFRIDGKAGRVYVLRFFYAGQDYVKQL